MRTKTLFLTAVLGIAGALTASAQVYSVNAVGYVNISFPKGFSMFANPLKAADNTLAKLIPTAPANSTVYKFNPATGTYLTALFDDLENAWTGAAISLLPGEGAFINAAAAFQNTFVGEVMQGDSLKTSLPAGFSIASSQVPQEGRVDTVLNFPKVEGATIYQFDNASGGYKVNSFDFGEWSPSVPTPKVGEAFWAKMPAATDWVRSFNINTP